MITHSQAQLSHILWTNDPMGTCCNVNAGMEDEYDQIAATMIEFSATRPIDQAVKDAIVFWFDEYFYDKKKDQLHKCVF